MIWPSRLTSSSSHPNAWMVGASLLQFPPTPRWFLVLNVGHATMERLGICLLLNERRWRMNQKTEILFMIAFYLDFHHVPSIHFSHFPWPLFDALPDALLSRKQFLDVNSGSLHVWQELLVLLQKEISALSLQDCAPVRPSQEYWEMNVFSSTCWAMSGVCQNYWDNTNGFRNR